MADASAQGCCESEGTICLSVVVVNDYNRGDDLIFGQRRESIGQVRELSGKTLLSDNAGQRCFAPFGVNLIGGRCVKLFGEARPDFGELLHVLARALKHTAALHVCGPVRRVDERFLHVLAERLRHQGDEVLRDARVFEKRLDDGVGQTRLLVCKALRACRALFGIALGLDRIALARAGIFPALDAHPQASTRVSSAYQLPRTSGSAATRAAQTSRSPLKTRSSVPGCR